MQERQGWKQKPTGPAARMRYCGNRGHMSTTKLTSEIIAAAIEGFEAQKTRIDARIAELRAFLSGGAPEPAAAPAPPTQKRRKMSAAARKRIGDAQRKRWAESKKQSEPAKKARPKKKLSPARKAALVANLAKARAARAAKRAAA